jgi:D-alanyl-D-alanine carboxypeptidase (penicillin-binding protein 5/6)
MTALVALERAAPDDLVTVRSGAPEVGEAEIGLVAGESFPMALLLEAMLVRSANDAAVAVAEHIAGSVPAFVDLMNEKALELGLANTHFENPHGLDGEAHYTSARDLLTITLAAFQHRGFSDLVSSTEVIFPAAPDGTLREAQTTNHLLLDYRGAIGVKTGFTNRAGLVLVAAAERGGRTLLAVVMGSEGEGRHFTDAAALLDYGFVAAARLGVLMGGRYPATRDGSPSRLQREGILETLIYLHGAQLETAPLLQAAPSVVETVRTGPDPLPDLQASLGWINRYWRLWSGG